VKWIVALLAVALLSACTVPRLPSDASGSEVFGTICARCHGKDLAVQRLGRGRRLPK